MYIYTHTPILIEAEHIKERWQEYKEELYKKSSQTR